MFIRRSRYYILQLVNNKANAMGRTLFESEVNNVLNNPTYISDYEMFDED